MTVTEGFAYQGPLPVISAPRMPADASMAILQGILDVTTLLSRARAAQLVSHNYFMTKGRCASGMNQSAPAIGKLSCSTDPTGFGQL